MCDNELACIDSETLSVYHQKFTIKTG